MLLRAVSESQFMQLLPEGSSGVMYVSEGERGLALRRESSPFSIFTSAIKEWIGLGDPGLWSLFFVGKQSQSSTLPRPSGEGEQ